MPFSKPRCESRPLLEQMARLWPHLSRCSPTNAGRGGWDGQASSLLTGPAQQPSSLSSMPACGALTVSDVLVCPRSRHGVHNSPFVFLYWGSLQRREETWGAQQSSFPCPPAASRLRQSSEHPRVPGLLNSLNSVSGSLFQAFPSPKWWLTASIKL